MESLRKLCFYEGVFLDLKLYVRSYGNFILVPPDSEMKRRVDFGEIFWPVSGECSFRMHDRTCILRPGYVWYYPAGALHDYHPITPFQYCWMTIAGERSANFFEMLDVVPGLNRAGTCPQELFARLENDIVYHSREHRVNALNTAFRIVSQIPLRYNGYARIEKSMAHVRTIIDAEYARHDLSMVQLAESVHMHSGSFSRAFHREFKTTVTDYITYIRVKHAMEMLEKSELMIRDIADDCGFSNANYFARVFKNRTGFAPLGYRRAVQNAARLKLSRKADCSIEEVSHPEEI